MSGHRRVKRASPRSTLHAEQEWSPPRGVSGNKAGRDRSSRQGEEHTQGDAGRPTPAGAVTKTGAANEAGGADRKRRSFNATLDDDNNKT